MEPTNRNRKGSIPVPPSAAMPEEIKMPVDAPIVEDEAPVVEEKVNSKPVEPDSTVAVKPIPKVGIKFVALRNGFWQNSRKSQGDEFYVPEMKKVGEWMQCVDPGLEKQHQLMIRERKLAAAGK